MFRIKGIKHLFILLTLIGVIFGKMEMVHADEALSVSSTIDDEQVYVNTNVLSITIKGELLFAEGDMFIVEFPENIDISTVIEYNENWFTYLEREDDISNRTIKYRCKWLGEEPYPLELTLLFNTKNEDGHGEINVFFQPKEGEKTLLEGGNIQVASRYYVYQATGDFRVMLLSGLNYEIPVYIEYLRNRDEEHKNNFISSDTDNEYGDMKEFHGIFSFTKNPQHIFVAYITPQNGLNGTDFENIRKDPKLTLTSNQPIDLESIVVISQNANSAMTVIEPTSYEVFSFGDNHSVIIELPDCDVFEYQVVFRTGGENMARDAVSSVSMEYEDANADGVPIISQGDPQTTGRFSSSMENIAPWFIGIKDVYVFELSQIKDLSDEELKALLLDGVIAEDIEDGIITDIEVTIEGEGRPQDSVGTYKVIYFVEDSDGAQREEVVKLIIKDSTVEAELTIAKVVTGDFGNKMLPFDFSIVFKNIDTGTFYTDEIPYVIYRADGSWENAVFKDGESYSFKLAHGERIVLTVTAAAAISYEIKEVLVDGYWIETEKEEVLLSSVSVRVEGTGEVVNGELTNLISQSTIIYDNYRELVPQTAVNISDTSFGIMIFIIICFGMMYIFCRRKYDTKMN